MKEKKLTLNDLIRVTQFGTKFEIYTFNQSDDRYREMVFVSEYGKEFDYDHLEVVNVIAKAEKHLYVECVLRV